MALPRPPRSADLPRWCGLGRRLGISYLLLLPLLTACLLNATTYYRPSAERGRVTQNRCVPTESNIEFPVGPLNVGAYAVEGQRDVIATLTLPTQPAPNATGQPAWRSLRFSSGDFAIRDLDRNTVHKALRVRAFRNDQSDSLTAPYHANPGRSYFWVDVYVPNPAPKNFELSSPPLVIDGQEWPIPVLRFERKTWAGISPFNC